MGQTSKTMGTMDGSPPTPQRALPAPPCPAPLVSHEELVNQEPVTSLAQYIDMAFDVVDSQFKTA